MPEPYTALSGWPAVTERVRLGVLVSPAFRHQPAVLAKQVATLDVLSAGRAMCGLGVGWFAQEYAAAGIDFPSVDRAVRPPRGCAAGAAAAVGQGLAAVRGHDDHESTKRCATHGRCKPHVPIVVGGSGERRTLRLVARYADGCNLFGEPDVVTRKVAVLARHCHDDRPRRDEIDVSHLSTVLIGGDHDELGRIDRTAAAEANGCRAFARDTNAGTVADHYERAMRLVDAGVDDADRPPRRCRRARRDRTVGRT